MNKDKNSIVSPRGIPPVVEATSQQPINNPTQENQQHYLPQYVPQYTQQYVYPQQQYFPQYVQQLPYYAYNYVGETTVDKNSSYQEQLM